MRYRTFGRPGSRPTASRRPRRGGSGPPPGSRTETGNRGATVGQVPDVLTRLGVDALVTAVVHPLTWICHWLSPVVGGRRWSTFGVLETARRPEYGLASLTMECGPRLLDVGDFAGCGRARHGLGILARHDRVGASPGPTCSGTTPRVGVVDRGYPSLTPGRGTQRARRCARTRRQGRRQPLSRLRVGAYAGTVLLGQQVDTGPCCGGNRQQDASADGPRPVFQHVSDRLRDLFCDLLHVLLSRGTGDTSATQGVQRLAHLSAATTCTTVSAWVTPCMPGNRPL
jgi:hypothetical protein